MAKIKQEFTGDFNQIAREYDKLLQKQVKMEQQLGNLRKSAERTAAKKQSLSSRSVGLVKKELGSLASLAASYLTVTAAIQAANFELERKKRLEREAVDASTRIAEADAGIITNFDVDATKADFQQFERAVSKISIEAGFATQAPVKEAAAATLSATAGNAELTKEVLATVAPLLVNRPDDLAETASVIGAFTSKVEGLTAKQATALAVTTQNQARFVNLEAFKEVGPAVVGAVLNTVQTDRKEAAIDGLAAFAAIGQRLEDSTGAVTKTAVTGLTTALRRNFEIDQDKFKSLVESGSSIKDAREQSRLSFDQRLDKAQDLGERITAAINQGITPATTKDIKDGTANPAQRQLAADLEIQKDLLSKGFRGASKVVVENLISGHTTDVAKAFDSAQSKIRADESIVDAKIDLQQTATVQAVIASSDKKVAGLLEGSIVGSDQAVFGAINKIENDVLDKTGSQIFGSGVSNQLVSFARPLRAFIEGGSLYERFDQTLERINFRETAVRESAASPTRTNDLQVIADAKEALVELMQTVKEIRAGDNFDRNDNVDRNAQGGNAAAQSRIQDERD